MNDQQWHARLDVNGRTAGTGFLVDDRHIITCEHVIRDARGPVQVTFTADPDLPSVAADVKPSVVRRPRFADDDPGDLAVLFTRKHLPVKPAKLAPLTVLRWKTETLHAFGYPRNFDAGRIAPNLRVNTNHLIRNEAYELTAGDDVTSWLRPGFSGSAVFLPSNGDVVGMVLQASENDRNALMMPVDVMCRYEPDLLLKVHFEPLSPVAYHDLHDILLRHAQGLVAADLFRDMGQYSDWAVELPSRVSTALQLAEFIGTESFSTPKKTLTRLYALMHTILDGDVMSPAGRDSLATWTKQHLGVQRLGGTSATPAAVVVKIEPTAENSDSYRLDAWRVLGEGDEGRRVDGTPIDTSGDDVQHKAQDLVMAGISGLPARIRFIVEFVLPREWLLSREVDTWKAPPNFTRSLGRRYPVVVRDLDRYADAWHRREMEERWIDLRDGVSEPVWIRCDDERLHDPGFFDDQSAVFLASPPADPTVLNDILGVSVPIVAWTRAACANHSDDPDAACAGRRFIALLRAAMDPFDADAVPDTVLRLRRPSGPNEDGALREVGHAITLVWDDPSRSPYENPLGLA